jgi:hypothetical protein
MSRRPVPRSQRGCDAWLEHRVTPATAPLFTCSYCFIFYSQLLKRSLISAVRVRVLNIFRAEMFTPVFAISHGVRPISPGGARVARTARAALLSPRSGEKLGVLFRNRSIFVPRGLGDRSPVSNFGYIRAPGPPSRVHTIGPVLSIFWARAASDGALLRRSRGPKMPASRVGTGCRDVDIKGVRAQYIQSTDRPKTKTAS